MLLLRTNACWSPPLNIYDSWLEWFWSPLPQLVCLSPPLPIVALPQTAAVCVHLLAAFYGTERILRIIAMNLNPHSYRRILNHQYYLLLLLLSIQQHLKIIQMKHRFYFGFYSAAIQLFSLCCYVHRRCFAHLLLFLYLWNFELPYANRHEVKKNCCFFFSRSMKRIVNWNKMEFATINCQRNIHAKCECCTKECRTKNG